MQNRYVGDLGDFGKYGLLRALCDPRDDPDGTVLSLGVVWYLTCPEDNRDGKHVSYLNFDLPEPSPQNQEKFRKCDPCLYDALRNVLRTGARKVESIRQSSILPSGTEYYENPLTFEGITGTGRSLQKLRAARRREWLQGALDLTSECDVVFVDPDNGLEVETKPHHKRGPKHVFFHELSQYTQRDQSVVIYHHIARNGTAQEQIRERLTQIGERLGSAAIALRYRRGTARAFFIVPAQRHKDVLFCRAERFLRSPSWERHFKLVEPA